MKVFPALFKDGLSRFIAEFHMSETSHAYIFTKKEKAIRKHWLIATVVQFTGGALAFFMLALCFAPICSISFLRPTLELLVCLLGAWTLYSLVYKRPGTFFLTFCLVGGFLTFCRYSLPRIEGGIDLVPFSMVITNAIIYSWWLILSLKLRKINLKIKAPNPTCSEYLSDLSVIQDSSDLKELKTRFFGLIEKWPQYELKTFESYRSKKESLSGL